MKPKIDPAIVRDMTEVPYTAAIARIIIAVAKRLGTKVSANTMERAAQLMLQGQCVCDEMQGLYFGAPLPAHTSCRTAFGRHSHPWFRRHEFVPPVRNLDNRPMRLHPPPRDFSPI
jgi:EAL domain-containing protein (putative c-di-GMP-specific phosphodiesterase class I)